MSRSRVWVCCWAFQRQSCLLQHKAAGLDLECLYSELMHYKALTLRNFRELSGKKFLLCFITRHSLLESSFSGKCSLKCIFILLKGGNVLGNMGSITPCTHARSAAQWRSRALMPQSLSVSTSVPWHQGESLWIHESTADSWGHAAPFKCSKSCIEPPQDTASINHLLHLTPQEPLVSPWCYNIIPLVNYRSALSVHLSNVTLIQTS